MVNKIKKATAIVLFAMMLLPAMAMAWSTTTHPNGGTFTYGTNGTSAWANYYHGWMYHSSRVTLNGIGTNVYARAGSYSLASKSPVSGYSIGYYHNTY